MEAWLTGVGTGVGRLEEGSSPFTMPMPLVLFRLFLRVSSTWRRSTCRANTAAHTRADHQVVYGTEARTNQDTTLTSGFHFCIIEEKGDHLLGLQAALRPELATLDHHPVDLSTRQSTPCEAACEQPRPTSPSYPSLQTPPTSLFSLALCSIRSSIVPFTINRYTVTCRV